MQNAVCSTYFLVVIKILPYKACNMRSQDYATVGKPLSITIGHMVSQLPVASSPTRTNKWPIIVSSITTATAYLLTRFMGSPLHINTFQFNQYCPHDTTCAYINIAASYA